MATFYGTNAQKVQDAKTTDGNASFRQAFDGMWITERYTLSGTEAVNDVIKLGVVVPAGCVIMPAVSKVHVVTDPGTTFTVDLGVEEQDNILDGVSLAAAGFVQPTEPEYEVTTASELQATVTAVDTLTADAVIDFYIAVRQTS